MSANINSMMYYGDTPWHKQGVKVDKAQTSAEAIESAGLNWIVGQDPVKYLDKTDTDHFVNYRFDNKESLGIVGKGYRVLQNKEAFSFFDAIVGIKEAIYHTAGSLGKGERVWLLAKLPGYIKTSNEDISEKYLLLSNSHDGTSAVNIMFTPIRVVCQNTLNLALKDKSNKVSIRHTLNMGLKVNEIQKELRIINQKFSLFEEVSQKLSVIQLTNDAFKDYIKNSGVVPKESDSTRAENIMLEVSRLFETGKGSELKSSKGTLWGALNAVVEYVDHVRGGEDLNKRANSLLFRSGYTIKQKAFDHALSLIK